MTRSELARAASFTIAATLAGCAAPQPAAQAERERLAWAAGDTAAQARVIDEYVAKSFAAAPDKTALRVRSAIVAAHAADQARRVAAFRADGSEQSARTLKDLQARAEAIAEERRALQREWEIWQVEQGLKPAADAELVYLPRGSDC